MHASHRFAGLSEHTIRDLDGRRFLFDRRKRRFSGEFGTNCSRSAEVAVAVVDFSSQNGDLLGRLNSDFDGITIDSGDFDIDLLPDHHAFVNFSR